MKNIKKVLEMLKYNFWTLVKFEGIYKIVTFLIFTPLFLKLFNFIMNVTGYKYLTLENITSFLLNPLTLFLLVLLIILMTFYTMFDITNIIIILDMSYQKIPIKVSEAVVLSLEKCKNIFRMSNIFLAFFVLFLIPFLNIGVASSFISTIKIPEFIIEFILSNKILLPAFFFLLLLFTIFLLRSLYALHYFVLENDTFKNARKKSASLSKGTQVNDFISLLLINISLTVIYIIFVALGIFLIFGLNKILGTHLIIKSVATSVIWFFVLVSFLIFTVLTTPMSYACISVLYYFRKETKQEKIKHVSYKSKEYKTKRRKVNKFAFVCFLLSVIMGSIFSYGIYKGNYNLNIEHTRTTLVTAHRGSSINYPENTFAAFKAAKEEGADWIELDVQQTKDQKLIVIHDKNLKRVAGINKSIWTVTYEEIEYLDVGSFLNTSFHEERIPLLERVIDWAKENNMKLNIELKPTGHEIDFERQVIDLILEKEFENNCVLASQVYETLEKVKQINPSIKTVYIMSLLYGDIADFDKADHFSIEASNITKSLVNKIHEEGKELYVWTINTEENIRKMLDLKIDNIITDNVVLAKDIIYSSKTSDILEEYIKIIEELFQ